MGSIGRNRAQQRLRRQHPLYIQKFMHELAIGGQRQTQINCITAEACEFARGNCRCANPETSRIFPSNSSTEILIEHRSVFEVDQRTCVFRQPRPGGQQTAVPPSATA
jgi:hypothetical protein